MNRRIVAVNLARTCEPFPLPIALTSGVAPPSIAPPPSHLPIRGQPTIPYNIISSSLQFLSAEISPISEPTISSNRFSRCVLTSRVSAFHNYRAIVTQPTSRGNGRTVTIIITGPLCYALVVRFQRSTL